MTSLDTADRTQACICPTILVGPLYREPGTADATIAELERSDPEAAGLARAFAMYYRGDYRAAANEARSLLAAGCRFETTIGVSHVLSLEALFEGDEKKWIAARDLTAKREDATDGQAVLREINLAAIDCALFAKATFPKWFLEGCFDPLPTSYYPMGRYLYAKLLFMDTRFSELAAVVEPFISQSHAEKALLSEVYLRIIAAMGRYCTGDNDRAALHLRRALALALPDRLLSPFAEYRRQLGSLMDEVLREADPEALKVVIDLNDVILAGWTRLCNSLYHKRFTNELTAREYEVAWFAMMGLSNGEIARKMGISVNTVKLYLRNIYGKLGVSRRDELAPYIWEDLHTTQNSRFSGVVNSPQIL